MNALVASRGIAPFLKNFAHWRDYCPIPFGWCSFLMSNSTLAVLKTFVSVDIDIPVQPEKAALAGLLALTTSKVQDEISGRDAAIAMLVCTVHQRHMRRCLPSAS